MWFLRKNGINELKPCPPILAVPEEISRQLRICNAIVHTARRLSVNPSRENFRAVKSRHSPISIFGSDPFSARALRLYTGVMSYNYKRTDFQQRLNFGAGAEYRRK